MLDINPQDDNDKLEDPSNGEETNEPTSSSKFVKELVQRTSSIKKSIQPETLQGWAAFLSAISATILAYEIRLQRSLTAPPVIFGQYQSEPLRAIYEQLTATSTSILNRDIKPSLFIGTRGAIASAGAYFLGGPPKDGYIQFREIFTMPQDGASVSLDWELPAEQDGRSKEERLNEIKFGRIRQHVVLVLHGSCNDASFGYVRSTMRVCLEQGWVAAGMNFRGCGGLHLTTPRFYTSAYTGDLRAVVNTIASRMEKGASIFLVGNSLGANVLTKYLGEEGLENTLPECVAGGISRGNPLNLWSPAIPFPFPQLFGLGVKKEILMHIRTLRHMFKVPSFRKVFMDVMMAPTITDVERVSSHVMIANNPYPPFEMRVGYRKTSEYWHDASCYLRMPTVSVPLLVLTSEDDTLVQALSRPKLSFCVANPNVLVVNTKCGGHLGWQETSHTFGFGTSWADTATADFIHAILQGLKQNTPHDHQLRDKLSKSMREDALDEVAHFHSRL